MRKLVLGAFLAVMIVNAIAYVNILHAESTSNTFVIGVINSDTTWTLENSPYFLTGPVLVNKSVTLTIEPGVTVILNNNYIRVDGTLNAQGTTGDKITLLCNGTSATNPSLQFTGSSKNWSEQTKSGSIIENAVINSTLDTIISISQTSPKINNSTIIGVGVIDAAISVDNGGAPVISNNSISAPGILPDGTLAAGVGIKLNSANATISDNIIYGCRNGISTYLDKSVIKRNVLINNNVGIVISGVNGVTVSVENNTIIKNSIGIDIAGFPSPRIINNNIQEYQYGVYSDSFLLPLGSSNINATYNWWGTTNTSAINQTIHDFKNDFNLGVVDFIPILNAPNTQAAGVPTFTITASAGAGGSVSPNGDVSVSFGESQAFNVTANAGYQIASVLMDGQIYSAPYIFRNVISNGHTISATFEPVLPEFPSWTILALLVTAMLSVAVVFRGKMQIKPSLTSYLFLRN